MYFKSEQQYQDHRKKLWDSLSEDDRSDAIESILRLAFEIRDKQKPKQQKRRHKGRMKSRV